MSIAKELLLKACPEHTAVIPHELNGQAHDERLGKDFVSRCLGGGRLLGRDLGRALTEVVPALSPKQELLEGLCGLGRSHVVIADALDDGEWDESTVGFLGKWLDNLRTELRRKLTELRIPAGLLERHEQAAKAAFENFDFEHAQQAVQQKLAVFFLVLEIPELQADQKLAQVLNDFLTSYLFALQLIDDITDIEEDYRAPQNHNLLVGKANPESFLIICEHRRQVFAGLLTYIERNLEQFKTEPLFQNTLFEEYLQGMFFWISKQRAQINPITTLPIFPKRFDEHRLPLALPPAFERLQGKNACSRLPSGVSAPEAHQRLKCFMEASQASGMSSGGVS